MWRGGAALVAAFLFGSVPAAAQDEAALDQVAATAGLRVPERLCTLTRTLLRPYGPGLTAHYRGTASTMYFMLVPPIGSLAQYFAEDVQVTGSGMTPVRDLSGPAGPGRALGRLWRASLSGGSAMFDFLVVADRGPLRLRLRAQAAGASAEQGVREVECAIAAMARGRRRR